MTIILKIHCWSNCCALCKGIPQISGIGENPTFLNTRSRGRSYVGNYPERKQNLETRWLLIKQDGIRKLIPVAYVRYWELNLLLQTRKPIPVPTFIVLKSICFTAWSHPLTFLGFSSLVSWTWTHKIWIRIVNYQINVSARRCQIPNILSAAFKIEGFPKHKQGKCWDMQTWVLFLN